MTLAELVEAFLGEQRTECLLLEPERVLALGIAAAQFYAGYGHVNVLAYTPPEKPVEQPAPADPMAILIDKTARPKRLVEGPTLDPLPPVPFDEIAEDMVLTPSDWSIIRPLFLLYCEREQALMLESSRVMGVDVFGRASSEIQMDINTAELELPKKAFIQPVFTI